MHAKTYFSLVDPIVSDCDNGDIRLVGGATTLEGRVEVCLNNVWGAVCHHSFHNQEASVTCSQLGFQRAGQLFSKNSYCLIKIIIFCCII